MANAREIKSRVSSIQNTRKVTKAMEMISATKMRRAVAEVVNIRPYAHGAWSVLTNLSRSVKDSRNILLEKREKIENVLVILITSNRGLCGGFNAKIARIFNSYIYDQEALTRGELQQEKISREQNKKVKVSAISLGKKGEKIALSQDIPLLASFHDLMHAPSFSETCTVADMAMREFTEKRFDKVCVIYTDFISAMTHQTKIRQILPLDTVEFEKQLAEMDVLAKEFGIERAPFEYKVEPSPQEVLEVLLPSLIRTMMYHMVLESNASKEASRMIAMKNATDAAGEIADDLTLAYNRIRQAKITQEIAEISAGRASLEQ